MSEQESKRDNKLNRSKSYIPEQQEEISTENEITRTITPLGKNRKDEAKKSISKSKSKNEEENVIRKKRQSITPGGSQ